MENSIQITKIESNSRIKKLVDELEFAISRTSSKNMIIWGKESVKIFSKVTLRRGKGLLKALGSTAKFALVEVFDFTASAITGELGSYGRKKFEQSKTIVSELSSQSKMVLKALYTGLKANPKEYAPQVFIGILGFFIGSGGLDGDGGIPDLDLKGGIGNHRSIWTHSVLPAILIEGLIMSFVILVDMIYNKLPKEHDPFWESFKNSTNKISDAFIIGSCTGIAYHLFIDSNVLDPSKSSVKAYVDLPFSTTNDMHQGILFSNSAAEFLDIKNKVN